MNETRSLLAKVLLLASCSGGALAQQMQPSPSNPKISFAWTHLAIESLDTLIAKNYFDQSSVPRIQDALRYAENRGEYASATEPEDLARRLTGTLYVASHDKHLYVLPTSPGTLFSPAALPRAERSRMENFGFSKADILPGNIGYLKIDAFYRASEGAKTEQAAMDYVANVDALILDLRDNGGGSPDTAVQLLSYFLKESGLPLFEIIPRSGDPSVYKTIVDCVSYRNEGMPLYVLVSGSTFSGGEAVPFILQERRRATIIGETTAGAANPESPWQLNTFLTVTIPFGHIETSTSRKNWEGDGVHPDIATSKEKALHIAYIQALNKLLSSTTDHEKRALLIQDTQQANEGRP